MKNSDDHSLDEEVLVEILKIKKQRQKYLITTSLDETNPIAFSENQLVDNRIFPKQVFTLKQWQEILQKQSASDLFDRALYSLSFSLKTEKEMTDHLRNLNATAEDVTKVIKRLKELKYLDDEKFAKEYLNYAIRNYKGPKYIVQVFQQKGLNRAIIDEVMINYHQKMIDENLDYLIKKEIPKLTKLPIVKQKEKIIQKLLRLGYHNQDIFRNLNNFKFTSDHQETLYQELKKLLKQDIDLPKIKSRLRSKGYNLTEINQALQAIQENEVY